jgi:hypothetical protein
MKYVKILGLLAVAAAAMMAFAATASATTLTSPTGTVYTGSLHAIHEGTHVTLQNPIAKIECNSTVEGAIEHHGTGQTVTGNITSLSFTNCTNEWHVTVVAAGSLELHHKASGEGTVTSSGATVEATRFGVNCRYKTENTDLGTITDSHKTGATATMDIHALIPFHSGSFLCGSGATTWEGNYSVTTPDLLYIDA